MGLGQLELKLSGSDASHALHPGETAVLGRKEGKAHLGHESDRSYAFLEYKRANEVGTRQGEIPLGELSLVTLNECGTLNGIVVGMNETIGLADVSLIAKGAAISVRTRYASGIEEPLTIVYDDCIFTLSEVERAFDLGVDQPWSSPKGLGTLLITDRTSGGIEGYALTDQAVSVGRDDSAGIVIASPFVSSKQFTVQVMEGRGVIAKNRGSTNVFSRTPGYRIQIHEPNNPFQIFDGTQVLFGGNGIDPSTCQYSLAVVSKYANQPG